MSILTYCSPKCALMNVIFCLTVWEVCTVCGLLLGVVREKGVINAVTLSSSLLVILSTIKKNYSEYVNNL